MQKPNITLIIADDHPMMLKGLQQELEQVGYHILATAENGASAIEAIKNNNPDIALLDIEMPFLNGFEVVKRLKDFNLKTRYIVMSYHKEKGFILQARKVGVQGYLLKEDSIVEIEQCITQVMQGNDFYSNFFNEDYKVLTENELRKISQLTPSERTIIRLVSQNKTSLEICEILSISKRTVDKHRTNIIAKLELESLNNSLLDWIHTHEEIVLTL